MSHRLQNANIFAAVMLAFYGGFSVLASVLLTAFPSLPYPLATSTVFIYLFGFGLPCLLYGLLNKKLYLAPLRETFSFRKLPVLSVLLLLVIAVFLQPVMSLIALLAQFFFRDITTASIEGMTVMPLWLMVLSTAVLPAVFEELLCRGALMDGYGETPVWYQILIPGLFFGFLHLNFQQISYAAVMGIYLAVLLLITRSLWATMLVHLIFNGTQVTLAWLQENTTLLSHLTAVGETATLSQQLTQTVILAIPSLLVVVGATLLLARIHHVKDREKRMVQPGWHRGGWIMYLVIGFLFILSLIVELLMPFLSQFM